MWMMLRKFASFLYSSLNREEPPLKTYKKVGIDHIEEKSKGETMYCQPIRIDQSRIFYISPEKRELILSFASLMLMLSPTSYDYQIWCLKRCLPNSFLSETILFHSSILHRIYFHAHFTIRMSMSKWWVHLPSRSLYDLYMISIWFYAFLWLLAYHPPLISPSKFTDDFAYANYRFSTHLFKWIRVPSSHTI